MITQKQLQGFKEGINATYDGAGGVMAGGGINPLNSTSMTASGMSLQNNANGLVGSRQIPLNKFSRGGMRGALLNKNAAQK